MGTLSKMLSFKVVTILSMLFTLASLMPGKKYLVEIDSDELTPEDEIFESYYDSFDPCRKSSNKQMIPQPRIGRKKRSITLDPCRRCFQQKSSNKQMIPQPRIGRK